MKNQLSLCLLFFGLLAALTAASPWERIVDDAFAQSAARCHDCHEAGYTIEVRVEAPDRKDIWSRKYGSSEEDEAKDWAKAQKGCGISVYRRPLVQGGRLGLGTRSFCS